jgi:hypothetical protein
MFATRNAPTPDEVPTVTSKDDPVVSLSGDPVYYHKEAKGFEAPEGDGSVEQISAHIEKTLGAVESVFHELVSDTVHIDVHYVKPTTDFPFVRLVTSGMSDLRMVVPQHIDAPGYLELLMTLPGDWQLEQKAFEDERWYWPIRLMKTLARLPHKYNTWLGFGHSVPNGDPPEPYAPGTKLCGSILLPSITVDDAFHTLRIHQFKEISFLAVVPLYEQEMNFKLRSGSDALTDRFQRAGINDIVDVSRKNVARKLFGIF